MLPNGKSNSEAIKQNLSDDVVSTLSDFLNYNDDYELTDKYIGRVVDNKDPDKLGRCRIRVFGVFGDNVQDDELPWALPDPNFIGSLVGSFIVPPVDCIVSVYFERGEIYLPRYNRKVIDETKMPTNKDDDYPDNMVFFETDNGDKFEINRKKKTTLFEHASGTKIEIDATGNVTIDSVGNINTKHGLFLEDNGSAVIPTGTGPYCALPTCVITGAPQTGQRCAPGGV